MLLTSASHSNPLPTVMGIFGAFWVFVLIVLWFAVGALTKKAERKKHDAH